MALQLAADFFQLGKDFYQQVLPLPLTNPQLVALSDDCARLLQLDVTHLKDALWLSGQVSSDVTEPLAMIYAGHQFGHWVQQLGDGRALLLGERKVKDKLYDIVLKGAGPTPFSRMGDGKAVLRSCIREFLISEAMHGLNIPTTRALAISTGSHLVRRETLEPEAMLTRVSPCHIRFGSFEYFSYHQKSQQLQQLINYCLQRFYPECLSADKPVVAMVHEIAKRTGHLIAHWQAFGFCHGVMNTDNMSIVGETFDYGPFAFLDDTNLNYICNHSDVEGRYAFNNQPNIGAWNCYALCMAFKDILSQKEIEDILNSYKQAFGQTHISLYRKKLGLTSEQQEDEKLVGKLLTLMHQAQVDYTGFFRCLSEFNSEKLLSLFEYQDEIQAWHQAYLSRLKKEEKVSQSKRQKQMKKINPKYILRTHIAQQAIEQAYQGDFSMTQELYSALRSPFDEQPQYESLASPPKDDEKGISLSCSS